jgi:hypothetical protein
MENISTCLDEVSLIVVSHLSEIRLETIKREIYSLGSRRKRLVAAEKSKEKLEKLIVDNRTDINQNQMAAILDVYSDLVGLVRSLRTCVDRNSADAAYHLDKVRDITDLRHTNAANIVSQEQEAKSQGVPHYFREN